MRITDTTRPSPAWILLGVVAAALVGAALLGPVPQDPAYHQFADSRSCGRIPNCLNVLSNLAFVIVGAMGLRSVSGWPPTLRPAFWVFWWGVLLTGLGSAWYHWAPDDGRLVWDRLPMTLAFSGLFAAILMDQVRLGAWILPFLVAVGLASIGVWVISGDLRMYGLVQFLPPLLMVLIFVLYPPGRIPRWKLWLALAAYALAKAAEFLDVPIFELAGISGHTFKHLLAAGAPACLIRQV